MLRNPSLALIALPLLAACGQDPSVTEEVASVPVLESSMEQADAPVLSEEMVGLITAEFEDFMTVSYRAGAVDLNGDGTEEWLVFVTGPGICGYDGCPLRVFQSTPEGIETKGQLSLAKMPVGVFESETNGWRDLAVTIDGGGGELALAKVPYEGTAYASNPTVAPAAPSSEEFTTVIEVPEM